MEKPAWQNGLNMTASRALEALVKTSAPVVQSTEPTGYVARNTAARRAQCIRWFGACTY